MLTPMNAGRPKRPVKRQPVRPELCPVVIGEKAFAFDPLTLEVYRVTLPLLRALDDAPHLLRPGPAPVFPDPGGFPSCSSLVINITHRCNLRCRYCFVREQTVAKSREELDLPVEAALGAIRALCPDRVGFFGGEPMMRFDALREIVEIVEKEFPKTRFSCTTNGTLIDDEAAAWFAARRDRCSFIVSLDGDPERHNQLRPLPDGDSHAGALAGLRRLAEAGYRPTLRGTFTADGCDLAAELEILNNLCDEGLGGHVSIEPVSLTEGCAFGRLAITPERMRAMEPMFMAAADWFVARARAGKRARYHHLTKFIQRLYEKVPQCTECGAGRGYLTLSPDLSLHACHREKSRVGKLIGSENDWEIFFDNTAREAWRDNRLEVHADCPSCPYRYLCGGGCRLDGIDQTGDVRRPDPANCELTRMRLRMAIRVIDALGITAAARAAGVAS